MSHRQRFQMYLHRELVLVLVLVLVLEVLQKCQRFHRQRFQMFRNGGLLYHS
jgi:hypothetical protein